jgi:hypothetical protein
MAKTLREQLIGAWKLVSYVEKPTDGFQPFYPMGTEPKGIIMYTPDGYMSAQLEHPGRPKLRIGRLVQGHAGGNQGRGIRLYRLFRALPHGRKKTAPHALDVRVSVPELDRHDAAARSSHRG